MAELLAGAFKATPAYIQIMRGGTVGFFGADNATCWSDPNGRILVSSMKDALTLLDVHGFMRGAEIPPPEGGVALGRFAVVSKHTPVEPKHPAEPVDDSSLLRARVLELEAELASLRDQIAISIRDSQAAWVRVNDENTALKAQIATLRKNGGRR